MKLRSLLICGRRKEFIIVHWQWPTREEEEEAVFAFKTAIQQLMIRRIVFSPHDAGGSGRTRRKYETIYESTPAYRHYNTIFSKGERRKLHFSLFEFRTYALKLVSIYSLKVWHYYFFVDIFFRVSVLN